jgi:subtilisin family serine protease
MAVFFARKTSAIPRGEAMRNRTQRSLTLETLEGRQLMAVDALQISQQLHDENELLVQFRSPVPSALIGQRYAGTTVQRQLTDDGWFKIEVGAGITLNQAIAAYQGRSDVIQASPDFEITAQAIPNDPSFGSLWGLSNSSLSTADINADKAWDFGTSTSVVTAIIDTGVDYRHQDLAANIWSNTHEIGGNGIDDDRNGYIDDTRGWDFANKDNDPMDDNGHGTHVAGTIGAVGNNGIGVSGVAWSASIMPLKFLDKNGSGALSDAIEAINYARVNGAKVINASWGGGGFSSALQSAITQFKNAGGVFVAAAGNESSNNAITPAYPANYAGVISVGASTRTDTLASFSNFGTNVQIVAPGQSILSTLPGNAYGTLSGTSMATPHVAGAIALLWGQNPTRTATQITDAIFANTDNVLRGTQSTYGRLNLGKAAAALRQTAPPTNPPTNPPANPQQTKVTYSLQGSYALRDATNQATVQQFAIDVPDNVAIADLDVVLNIQHTYVSDLGIRLIGPDGTSRTLVNRRGGSSDDIQLTLSDEAATGVALLGLLRGTARPESNLSGFDGKSAKGRWILQVTDYARGDVGQLLGAQLVVTTSSPISPAGTTSNKGFSGADTEQTREQIAVIDSHRRAVSEFLMELVRGTQNTASASVQNINEDLETIANLETAFRTRNSLLRQTVRRG